MCSLKLDPTRTIRCGKVLLGPDSAEAGLGQHR